MDLQTIYPASITPKFLTSIKDYYIETYHDQFFVSPPIYFQLFIWLELVVHVPVSFWAVGALLKGESEVSFSVSILCWMIMLPQDASIFFETGRFRRLKLGYLVEQLLGSPKGRQACEAHK
jgi:hypothetical protein